VHSAGPAPAGEHGQDGYGERAETYLRLLAEAALRPAADGNISRVGRAADVLVDAGALSGQTAAEILADLRIALRVRGRREVVAAGGRLSRLMGFRPGNPLGQPGSARVPWRIIPLGPPPPGSRLTALIRTADRALAHAILQFSPIALLDPEMPPLARLTATDDLGTDYRIGFPDGTWAGSTWTGTIALHPAPPPAATKIEIISPNGSMLRADLITAPRAERTAETAPQPVPDSPGERLLDRRGEMLLAVYAGGHAVTQVLSRSALADLVSVLEAAGLLSPLSPASVRLAALGQLLGLATQGPISEIPAQWMTVVAHYGRRRRPAPATGTAAVGAVLPEIDGARFAVTGLHSALQGTFLHVVAEGLRALSPRPPGLTWSPTRSGNPAQATDTGFSWWVRDDADGWHLAAFDELNPVGGRQGVLRMALLPPLTHHTTALALRVTGPSTRLAVNLPVHW
jgi:hypothetical protein